MNHPAVKSLPLTSRNPVLEDETAKVNSSQVKADSEGLAPGERQTVTVPLRFKQIKEQEVRRRKQREEDKRRAEEEKKKAAEAAAGSLTITEQKVPEVELAGNIDKKGSENSQTTIHFSTIDNGGLRFKAGPTVNGEESSDKNVQ